MNNITERKLPTPRVDSVASDCYPEGTECIPADLARDLERDIIQLREDSGEPCPRCKRPMRIEGGEGFVCWCCRNFDAEERLKFVTERAEKAERMEIAEGWYFATKGDHSEYVKIRLDGELGLVVDVAGQDTKYSEELWRYGESSGWSLSPISK